jgi:SAM-dependent methyltransferase
MKEDWKYEKIYGGEGKISTPYANDDSEHSQIVSDCKRKDYGHGNTGKAFISSVLELNPKSLLDVGCGYNEFCHDLVRTHHRPCPFCFDRSDKVWQANLGSRMNDNNQHADEQGNWTSRDNLPDHPLFTVGVDCACPGADVIATAGDLPFHNNSFDIITSFDCMEHIAEEEIEQVMDELHRVTNKHVFLQIDLADHGTKIDGELLHVTLKERDWWNDMIGKKFKIEITHELYTSKHPGLSSNINGKAVARIAHKSTEDLHIVKGIKK